MYFMNLVTFKVESRGCTESLTQSSQGSLGKGKEGVGVGSSVKLKLQVLLYQTQETSLL